MSKSAEYRRLIGSVEWRRLRDKYVSEHPWCERCEREAGVYTPTQCVHHKVPCESMRGDALRRLCLSEDNLQALCYNCHRWVHVHELGSASRECRERTNNNIVESFKDKFL